MWRSNSSRVLRERYVCRSLKIGLFTSSLLWVRRIATRLSVCLSVGLHISNTTCQTSRNFPYTLSVVTALSSSDINALPILWMTPCLLIIGYKLRGWYGVSLTVTHQGVVPGAKSWSRYDCFVSVKISAEIRLQPNSPTVYVIARPTGTFYGQSLPERSDFRTAVTNAVYATVQWWTWG